MIKYDEWTIHGIWLLDICFSRKQVALAEIRYHQPSTS